MSTMHWREMVTHMPIWPLKMTRSKKKDQNKKEQLRFVCLHRYIQWVLEAIARVLAKIDIHTYFKLMNTIRSMVSHPKDWVLLLNQFGVVYKVECGCCSALYAGETKRRLESRLAEHWKAVQRGEVNASALAEHVWNIGHHVNWDSMEVLGVSSRHYSRLA